MKHSTAILIMLSAFASSTLAFNVARTALRPAFVATSQLATTTTTSQRLGTARFMSSTPEEFAKSEIANNDVVVFSKTWCGFCAATKATLDDLNIEYKLNELDQMDNGADVQAALRDLTGQRTVPNVFVKGQHVGGNDNVQAAVRSGDFQKLLETTP